MRAFSIQSQLFNGQNEKVTLSGRKKKDFLCKNIQRFNNRKYIVTFYLLFFPPYYHPYFPIIVIPVSLSYMSSQMSLLKKFSFKYSSGKVLNWSTDFQIGFFTQVFRLN